MGVLANIAAALAPRADTPVPYTSRATAFTTAIDTSSRTEQMQAMGSVGTLFAIVEGLSSGTAKWEWWLERDRDGRGRVPDAPKPVTSHPALDLWETPNEFMSRRDLVEAVQQHLDLTGEGYVVAVRLTKTGPPVELWPVRPDRMTPVPHAQKFLTGWVYTSPDGEKVPLEVADVMQLKYPNPLDPYRGLGPVQAILVDLDSAKYSAQWNRNFFLNSAEPGGIVEVPETWDDDEFRQFQARWREQHRGVAAAHRVGVLEGGAKWVERKFSMRDMQFEQLREVSRSIVREAFRVSKTILGQTEDVNRATAEAAEYVFGAWLIDPRLSRWQGVLQSRLLPMFGTAGNGVRWCYEDPSPANVELEATDRDSRVSAAVSLIGVGARPESTMEAFGLPEVEWGPKPAPPSPPAAFAPWLKPRNATDDQVDRVAKDWEKALDAVLDDWPGITKDQRAELHDQIEEAVDDGDLAALAALTVDSTAAAALLAEAMGVLADTAAGRVVEEAATQGVTIDPVPAEGLATFAAVSAGLLAAGLAAAAGREALRIHRDGMSGAEVADAVDEHLASLSDASVRTEVGGALSTAQNQSRLATLREAPDATYQANEVNDTNRCGPCSDIDGRTFDDLDDAAAAYPTGGYVRCEGRQRCRGIVTADWSTATEDRATAVPALYAPWLRTNGRHPVGVG